MPYKFNKTIPSEIVGTGWDRYSKPEITEPVKEAALQYKEEAELERWVAQEIQRNRRRAERRMVKGESRRQ